MSETSPDGAINLDDLAHLEITNVITLGDSPLAHSLRRRRQEIDSSEEVIATHDNRI